MAVNELYLLTLFGDIMGQQTVNTFTYYQVSAETSAETSAHVLAEAFIDAFVQAGIGFCSGGISQEQSYTAVRVVNLFEDVSDFAEIALPTTAKGASTDAAMPPFVAYSFRTPWLGSGVRRGFKRFGGVRETVVTNGVIEPAAIADLQSEIGDALAQPLSVGNGDYQHVVVRRVKTLDPETGKYSYDYPTNVGELYQVEPSVWVIQPNISTQNSRKFGRGI